jgi:hypothetical protein
MAFAGADQRVEYRRTAAALVVSHEEIIFAAQGDWAERILGGVMPPSGLCRVRAPRWRVVVGELFPLGVCHAA